MRTFNFNELAELVGLFSDFPKKEKKTEKLPKFVVHIDVKRNSGVLKAFNNFLNTLTNLKMEKDPLFGLVDMPTVVGKGDALTVGFSITGEKVDVSIITKQMMRDFDIYIKSSIPEYTLSKDFGKIINEFVKLNKQRGDAKKATTNTNYYQLTEQEEVPHVRIHEHFVTIGWSRYNIKRDLLGQPYIEVGNRLFAVIDGGLEELFQA
jgi:hypothetical protein